MRDAIVSNKAFLIIMGVILVLLAAAYPGTRWLDSRTDVKTPLYTDREMVVWLVYESTVEGKTPEAMTITPDQTVTIAGGTFTPSPGNTVEVTLKGAKYCVKVSDNAGHHTGVQCWGPGVKPPKPNDTTINY